MVVPFIGGGGVVAQEGALRRVGVRRAEHGGHRVRGVAVVGLEAHVDGGVRRDQGLGDLEGGDPAGSDLPEREHLVGARVEEPRVVELAPWRARATTRVAICIRVIAWSVPIDTFPVAGPSTGSRVAVRLAAAGGARPCPRGHERRAPSPAPGADGHQGDRGRRRPAGFRRRGRRATRARAPRAGRPARPAREPLARGCGGRGSATRARGRRPPAPPGSAGSHEVLGGGHGHGVGQLAAQQRDQVRVRSFIVASSLSPGGQDHHWASRRVPREAGP